VAAAAGLTAAAAINADLVAEDTDTAVDGYRHRVRTTWEVLAAAARPRAAVDPDGRDITVHDAVLVARRHA
jgi:hypothetical protein